MPRKCQAKAQSVEDMRISEEMAEELIAEWKRNPKGSLDLSGLRLKKVPETLRKVRALKLLDLSNNEIQELPRWIGELSALQAIALSGNHLRTLPSAVGSLHRLVGLFLAVNRLETLPETLRTLSLKYLHLEFNRALDLPDSILKRPPAEILRYYFESRDEKGRPLLELKLLLVGRGGAGKTTLVKRLAGEAPDAHEPETHSIAIRELTLACPRGQVRTRVWDFGGQEILHALGLALYFGKDPRLHDTRVLKPSWVTGGVYAVIRAPSVAENGGTLDQREGIARGGAAGNADAEAAHPARRDGRGERAS